MKKSTEEARDIARYINRWLNEYAPSQKSSSTHTIRSYAQSLSLYIGFLAIEKKIEPANLCSGCFCCANIEEWLVWLVRNRKSSPETCNNRLAALRAFLKYLGCRDVSLLLLSHDASQIPRRKTFRKKINGMSKKAMQVLLSKPDILTRTGRRDLVLLIVMYNTAARIDEILSMKIKHLQLETEKPTVTVIGKGCKIRTLYLLPKAVTHLKKYLLDFHQEKPNQESYVFYSRNAGVMGKMSQTAINKQLRKYAASARSTCDEVPINLHAHQIRHAKASHWLEDGMNIVQISFLLGHSNIQTTMGYLDITTEQEAKALATLEDENKKNVPKKWKSETNSLAAFCGIHEIRK
jgi:site-specific recombinase XerD